MATFVLAHGNGWDEILMVVVSFGIIGALILTARSRAKAEEEGAQAARSAEPGSVDDR